MTELYGVQVTPLLQIPDNRGTVKRFLRVDEMTTQFEECYVTTIYKNIIKGWHGYYTKTINFAVVSGMAKFVLYDTRENSPTFQMTQELYLGDYNYRRVTIPPKVMNAIQGISDESVMVVIANEVFDEGITIRKTLDEIPYDWSKINR